MSRNQSIALATLGLAAAAVFGSLGAYAWLHWPLEGFPLMTALLHKGTTQAPVLITLDSCIVGIMIIGLALGLARWRAAATAKQENEKSTIVNVPLYTCPICLAGPVVQVDKSTLLGSSTRRQFVCRACGSILEPVGNAYRYRKISSDYPDMKRHSKEVFYSWHELRNLAWKHPKRQRPAVERARRVGASSATQGRGRNGKAAQEAPPKGLPGASEERVLSPRATHAPAQEIRTLEQFIGQHKMKEKLSVSIEAAKARGDALGHVLLRGPEGCGKKTLAGVIANEMDSRITVISGQTIERPGDLAAVITNLGDHDILLVDDIHRLRRGVEERLCAAMQDFAFDVIIGKGIGGKTIHLPTPHMTVIGATDEPEKVSPRLRQSFEYVFDFEPYEVWALVTLVQRLAQDLRVSIDENARLVIARSCDGRMREAQRLLLRMRDYAQVRADGVITGGIAQEALSMMGDQRPGGGFEGLPTTPQEREAAPSDLTWQEFEDRVAQLFQTVGFRNVRLTPRRRDGGKDIVMEVPDPLRQNRVICVECKHWRANSVGIGEVKQLHSLVVGDPKVDRGVIVTTGTFSGPAVAYAKRVGLIDLIDGSKLREMMAKAGIQLD